MQNKVKSLNEINSEAIDILTKEMGVANTIRSINQYHTGLGNYTKERRMLFKNLTTDEIIADIEENSDKGKEEN